MGLEMGGETGDEITAADFDIPNLDQFGDTTIWHIMRDPPLRQKCAQCGISRLLPGAPEQAGPS